jgi:hypothetical protein
MLSTDVWCGKDGSCCRQTGGHRKQLTVNGLRGKVVMKVVFMLVHSRGLAPTNIPRRLRHLLGFIVSLCVANVNRSNYIKLKHKMCKEFLKYIHICTQSVKEFAPKLSPVRNVKLINLGSVGPCILTHSNESTN